MCRRAFWVPVGVRRSKREQHLYRCCVIFIALLHLLGGISFSVNNQVNCIQTCSGTRANFFYCYANSSDHPLHPSTKNTQSFLHPHNPMTPASPPKTLPASVKKGFMVPRRESGRAVCGNGFTSQETDMLGCTPLFHVGGRDSHSRLPRPQPLLQDTPARKEQDNNLQPYRNPELAFVLYIMAVYG